MQAWRRTNVKSLAMPGGIVLLAVAALVHSGWLAPAMPALNLFCYGAFLAGMMLAWRFHASRMFFALLTLFLAWQAISISGPGHVSTGAGRTALLAVAVLVPLNFAVIAWMQERGFTVSAAAPITLFLFAQSVVVIVMCRAAEGTPALLTRGRHVVNAAVFPGYAVLVLAGAGIALLARTLVTRKPADSALFWALGAFSLSAYFATSARTSSIYSAAGACILAVSIIENSYLLAYYDELTALPSRRAFNDTLAGLQHPFSIAAVDIDHFKRFNDTYGHDTGDEVLRLVAAHLARVDGGGHAFRCGGEEFTILFPGKTIPEVADHVERLRIAVAASEFHLRAGERRQAPRGPDRRNVRGRTRTGHAIRKLARAGPAPISVTVSIGVAASAGEKSRPDAVLQAADKALYRAKANGRNRVETGTFDRRRVKTAGIA